MIVKDLIEELTGLPGAAEVYVKHGDALLRVDSVGKLEDPLDAPGVVIAEITASSANWPLFRSGR